jgi:long-subunit fatty acid transport protein
MKTKTAAAFLAATALSTTGAVAGALDRSYQNIGVLFEPGNYAELSFAAVDPEASGRDTTVPQTISDVAEDFNQFAAGVKYQFSPMLSFALIADKPYGSDVVYPGNPAASAFGGTRVDVNSIALTGLARYHFNENMSVHGGLRYQQIGGDVALSGLAYGPLSGYSATIDDDSAVGYVIGAAYEMPEIALRVSLTYHSAVEHDVRVTERISGVGVVANGTTEIETPEAIQLEFQTGVAEDTLVFGSIRHANWSEVRLIPDFIRAQPTGQSLINLDDVTTYTLGVGRRVTDALSVSASVGYEPEQDSDLVSPLSPTNGRKWVGLGTRYTMGNVEYSAGVRYTWLGDARPQTGGIPRAVFEDNDIVVVGAKIGYRF